MSNPAVGYLLAVAHIVSTVPCRSLSYGKPMRFSWLTEDAQAICVLIM